MDKEAAVITTAVTGFIAAVIGLLVAFNISVTPDQKNAIIATVIAFSVLIVAVGPVIRQFVYSRNSVEIISKTASTTDLGERVRRA